MSRRHHPSSVTSVPACHNSNQQQGAARNVDNANLTNPTLWVWIRLMQDSNSLRHGCLGLYGAFYQGPFFMSGMSTSPYLVACNSRGPSRSCARQYFRCIMHLPQGDTYLLRGEIANVMLLGFHNARDARCNHHPEFLQHLDLPRVVCLQH